VQATSSPDQSLNVLVLRVGCDATDFSARAAPETLGRAANRTPKALPQFPALASGYASRSPSPSRSVGNGAKCQSRVPMAISGGPGKAGRDHCCLVDRRLQDVFSR
jgi:hypothetical protein